jgi:hypothetical protein
MANSKSSGWVTNEQKHCCMTWKKRCTLRKICPSATCPPQIPYNHTCTFVKRTKYYFKQCLLGARQSKVSFRQQYIWAYKHLFYYGCPPTMIFSINKSTNRQSIWFLTQPVLTLWFYSYMLRSSSISVQKLSIKGQSAYQNIHVHCENSQIYSIYSTFPYLRKHYSGYYVVVFSL